MRTRFVAEGFLDIWGDGDAIETPLNVNEYGMPHSGTYVWTGTDLYGFANTFQLGDTGVAIGRMQSSSGDWIHAAETWHASQLPLYALSEVLSVPWTGDYDDDCFVSQADLDLVLLSWGDDFAIDPVPAAWVNQIPSGLVGQEALDNVLLNWGDGVPPLRAIPEPATAIMLLLGMVAAICRRRG